MAQSDIQGVEITDKQIKVIPSRDALGRLSVLSSVSATLNFTLGNGVAITASLVEESIPGRPAATVKLLVLGRQDGADITAEDRGHLIDKAAVICQMPKGWAADLKSKYVTTGESTVPTVGARVISSRPPDRALPTSTYQEGMRATGRPKGEGGPSGR
jgi:hypothetical protein